MAAPVAAITVFAAADGAPKAGRQAEKEMAKQLRGGEDIPENNIPSAGCITIQIHFHCILYSLYRPCIMCLIFTAFRFFHFISQYVLLYFVCVRACACMHVRSDTE